MGQLARIVLAAVTFAGCAHEASRSSTSERSAAGADVAVAVVSYDRIERNAVDQTSFPSLRVRMTLTNHGALAWTVRPSEQIAFIEDYGPSMPAAASDQRTLVVAPGETRTLELFYPVPRPEFAQTAPQRMSLQWRVRLPDRSIADRVRLDHELASITPPRS